MKPITRKEKIIAGEELTPITREEMFLQKYGGNGGGGIKTAIIKQDGYDNALAGIATTASSGEEDIRTYTCVNMTLEEAMQILHSGEPLAIMLLVYNEHGNSCRYAGDVGINKYAPNWILLTDSKDFIDIYWTATQISNAYPSE